MTRLNWERCREAKLAERYRQAGDHEQALLRAAGSDPTAPATGKQVRVLRQMERQFRRLGATRHAERLQFLLVGLYRWEASELIGKAGAELKRIRAGLSSASDADRPGSGPQGG